MSDTTETPESATTESAPIDADLVRALEAIILVASDPVPLELLSQILQQPAEVVESLCASLASAYEEAGHGFQLVQIAGGYRYQSHPDVAAYVERFILDGQRARLSGAALETLAIVAYKQPLSRAQIASIRELIPMVFCGRCKVVDTSIRSDAIQVRVRQCSGGQLQHS